MQDGVVSEANRKLDPENRLVWYRKPQRLQAEILRNALLAVGGGLDLKMYGPSVLDDAPRRSVYLRVKRSELIPMMTMFDAPEPTQSIGEREHDDPDPGADADELAVRAEDGRRTREARTRRA